VVGPMIGILGEALVAEMALSIAGKPRRIGFIVAGALGVVWPLAQPFITNPLLYGRTFFTVWLDLIDSGSRLFGLPSQAALAIVLALAALHAIAGLVAGWLAWDVGKILQARLGRGPLPTAAL
ncbi:MAG TPA: hypothetical protein VM537_02240, partial [Anaerolineae bacterium]|nr:hypothetical protein [Anaerolineae bacterium]